MINITGKITGSDAELLEFANVWESDATGKKVGLNTLTGISGNYSLQYQGSGFVSASFVGYKRKTVPVNGNNVNITLDSEVGEFSEVVVEEKKQPAKIQIVGGILLILSVAVIVYDRLKPKPGGA